MEDKGGEIWKQRKAESKIKAKRIANLLANGTLPAGASKLTIETVNSFCEHGGADGGNHMGRGCGQHKRKFIDLVDSLGGGEYRQEHEGRVVKRRGFSARQLAELTDLRDGLNYEAIDTLRGALSEKGTHERRNTPAAIVQASVDATTRRRYKKRASFFFFFFLAPKKASIPTRIDWKQVPSRIAAQRANMVLDDHLRSQGLLMQSPGHDDTMAGRRAPRHVMPRRANTQRRSNGQRGSTCPSRRGSTWDYIPKGEMP